MFTKKESSLKLTYQFVGILLLLIFLSCSQESIQITKLTTEYTSTPLGIDVRQPHFGWQMTGPESSRGLYQKSYQIIVKNPEGEIVWDTKKIGTSEAVGIKYRGTDLKAETRYDWTVIVWDQDDKQLTSESWFETGLLNPDPNLSAWEGAQWIGGGNEDLVFYAPYQMIFTIKYSMALESGSDKASFVYGANDGRLMDANKNLAHLENKKNESFIKLELDISEIESKPNGMAKLNIYRSGYTKDDQADKALASFSIKKTVINSSNKNADHHFEVVSAFGRIIVRLDDRGDFFVAAEDYKPAMTGFEGADPSQGLFVNLNPLGLGGDFLPFGMVCDMGFSAEKGQKAKFSNLTVSNSRKPNKVLFSEDLTADYDGIFAGSIKIGEGKYLIDGGQDGFFVVADPSRNSSPMLRTDFEADNNISSARLYVTARGIYKITMNGQNVGNDYFNPGLTQYNRTHMYQTYDVTNLLNKGSNTMGAILAEGWWSGLLSFVPIWNHFGDRQSLLAKMVITYKDGKRQLITTNEQDWKFYNDGPILYSSLDHGEIYDTDKEAAIKNWDKPGYDDANWKSAQEITLDSSSYTMTSDGLNPFIQEFNFDSLQIIGQIGNNPTVYKTLQAKSVKEVKPGIFVYNMGQNFVGVPKITIANANKGDTIVLRYAEMLYPDLAESGDNVGMIMTENYRAALCQDIYICKEGPQVIQPKFTFRGYQYLEITGLDIAPSIASVEGIAISSIQTLTADYASSNEKVNKLWSNLVWSNVDNFLSIPTDCPQRNERMGWSGDISVFSRTSTYVSNTAPFLKRHMQAMRDVQGPTGKFSDIAPVGGGFGGVLWGSAGITVPWEVYQQYNDRAILEEHYDAMVAYIDFLNSTVNPVTGISNNGQLGDWLGPQNNQISTAILATAYHVYDIWLVKNIANVLGRKEDEAKFASMYESRKAFFNKTFVNENGKTKAFLGGPGVFMSAHGPEGSWAEADVQTPYAVGLALDVFSPELQMSMAKNLANTVNRENMDDNGKLLPKSSLMTGFIGTAWISKALSDNGYDKEAYELLQSETYPSWLYAINQGATTIWERLNGYTVENGFGGNNSMNSFNHYSFGAVGQWLIAYSLGIQRDAPGFKKFVLQPRTDPTGKMTWAEGWYDSVYGRINSKWEKLGSGYAYHFTVPANTTATLILSHQAAEKITEKGQAFSGSKGVKFIESKDGKSWYEVGSGIYSIEVKM